MAAKKKTVAPGSHGIDPGIIAMGDAVRVVYDHRRALKIHGAKKTGAMDLEPREGTITGSKAPDDRGHVWITIHTSDAAGEYDLEVNIANRLTRGGWPVKSLYSAAEEKPAKEKPAKKKKSAASVRGEGKDDGLDSESDTVYTLLKGES